MSVDAHADIVIIGGGIIGVCSAYYLSSHPSFDRQKHRITLLEPSESGVAPGASGKAGGLLAKWAYPECLSARSFVEHVKLAERFGGEQRWGFRRVECGSLAATGRVESGIEGKSLDKNPPGKGGSAKKTGRKNGLSDELDWFYDDAVSSYDIMSSKEDGAQVHPRLFTTAMGEEAVKNGVRIVSGRATEIHYADEADAQGGKRVDGVSYIVTSSGAEEGQTQRLAARTVILAAGPWSHTLLPTIPSSTVRAHSIVYRPSRPVAAHCLFTEINYPRGANGATNVKKRNMEFQTPEIYTRPDGTIYACGPGDDAKLPPLASSVTTDRKALDALRAWLASISPLLAESTVETEQACFLPNVPGRDGGPIVGYARNTADGLLVATGHTCWGICNGPGTGKVVGELVWEGKAEGVEELEPERWKL